MALCVSDLSLLFASHSCMCVVVAFSPACAPQRRQRNCSAAEMSSAREAISLFFLQVHRLEKSSGGKSACLARHQISQSKHIAENGNGLLSARFLEKFDFAAALELGFQHSKPFVITKIQFQQI